MLAMIISDSHEVRQIGRQIDTYLNKQFFCFIFSTLNIVTIIHWLKKRKYDLQWLKQMRTYSSHKTASVRHLMLVQRLRVTGTVTLQFSHQSLMPHGYTVATKAPSIMTCSNQGKQRMPSQLLLYPFIRKAKTSSKMPAGFCFCLLTTVVSLNQP